MFRDRPEFLSGDRSRPLDLVPRGEEGEWVGFHHSAPVIGEVRQQITDRHRFLNFDDDAFAPQSGLREFLAERFPDPCRNESQIPETFLSGTASQ